MKQKSRRRLTWVASGSLALLLLGLGVWFYFARQHLLTWQFLAHVVQLEASEIDQTSIQPLGWSLAILGRDDEVRALDIHPQFKRSPSSLDENQLNLQVVPWKDAIQQIATEHRLVMIMEDHFFSKHREFIGATLPEFKDAGFTHYAAEAIGPLDLSLTERGYPINRTGLYTSDPQFGNVLRKAIELRFTLVGYDFDATSHENREEYAASRLADILNESKECRMVVHAGHAHVLKYETEYGGRWLAARLWDKTAIEPFTIWQWSGHHDAYDYEEIIRVLTESGTVLNEPVLLMPPPGQESGLKDSPYGQAKVDAIVIHPPDHSVAPADRTVLFPEHMQRITGRWVSGCWPVVVSAYPRGEPVEAIPFDQVMLRQNESEFALWIPEGTEYEIRVFSTAGELDTHAGTDREMLTISPANEE
ncbi:MAG: hypothetical protein KDA52_13320 [Planctomycetaceae bacterium]|nr:hypothetical protein [Planctomycetaceae bacterium]